MNINNPWELDKQERDQISNIAYDWCIKRNGVVIESEISERYARNMADEYNQSFGRGGLVVFSAEKIGSCK